MEHEFPLLIERGIRRRRFATEEGRGLGEDPRLRKRLAGDHHAVAAALAEPADGCLRRVDVAVAHHRHPRHASLHLGDRLPVGLALEELAGHAAVDGEARSPRLFDPLGHLHSGAARVGAAEPDLRGHGHAIAGLDHATDDGSHAVGVAEEPRAAVGFFRDLSHGTAEVEIDHAHLKILRQPAADLGQVFGIVVPHLHGERPRFVAHAPQPVGVFATVAVQPDRAPRRDHLGGQEARAAKLTDDLAVGEVGVARHRRLQDRWVNDHWADGERGGAGRGDHGPSVPLAAGGVADVGGAGCCCRHWIGVPISIDTNRSSGTEASATAIAYSAMSRL